MNPPLEDFHPKKRFGQNFLIDKNILAKILRSISLAKEDIVLEIGPGKGVLTKELAGLSKKVIAVEVDKKLFLGLEKDFTGFGNIKLINKDILKFDLKGFLTKQKIKDKIVVAANIPYSITTPILEYIFQNLFLIKDVYLMVQKEFAQRLIAKPNTKDYSSLSCFTGFHANVDLLFLVSRNCFRPRPKVDSYFIRLKPKEGELVKENKELLFKVIRTAFGQRRKNILNSLSGLFGKDIIFKTLEELNIDYKLRAENLSIQDYIKIANQIKNDHD